MSDPVSIPAEFSRFSYLADGGVSLGFKSQELSDDEKVKVAKYYGQFGWVVFSPNDVQIKDIPSISAKNSTLTYSQRMRMAIYGLADRRGIENKDNFYAEQMSKLIAKIDASE